MLLLEDAVSFAAKKHKGQLDKEGQPYILHPLRVMGMMETKDERIVAVLHDILEDTKTRPEELRKLGLNAKLIDAVEALTRRAEEDYFDYIRRVKKNRLARRVKLADIADNTDIKRTGWQKVPQKTRERLKKKYAAALCILKFK